MKIILVATMSETDSVYFSRGWDAAKENLDPVKDNPYHSTSHAGRVWLAGFYEYMDEFGSVSDDAF
jgi:hypothetical protein